MQQGWGLALKGQIHIGVVVGQHGITALGDGHGLLQPLLRTGGGGGVVGITQHQQAQLPLLLIAELLKSWAPTLIRKQRQTHQLTGGQRHPTGMAGVAGIQHQSRITGIEHRQRQMGGALLGAHQQQNFPLRIHAHTKALLHPGGRSLAKRSSGCLQAIAAAGGLRDGVGHHLQQPRWRLEIGAPQR